MLPLYLAVALPAVVSLAAAWPAVAADASTRDELARLSQRRIFFGHQSIGKNLLDGLQRLAAEEGAPLKIVETTEPGRVSPGTVAHALIGQNEDPAGKIADFERIMSSGMAEAVDVAFMKLCAADIDENTKDVAALFAVYRETMRNLRARYPQTTFLHVTVPIVSGEPWLKALVKPLLRRTRNAQDNARREEFNALMRQAYGGKEPLFDMARAESTWPDGRPETTALWFSRVPAMVPTYTTDSAHLSSFGGVHLARELVSILMKTP
jgi:hypothetical protein